MTADSAVYLASALLGSLVGGLISFAVSLTGSHRDRRARYGEALLETLGQAQGKVENALATLPEPSQDSPGAHREPLRLRDEARLIWAQTELASTLEWTVNGRRAMQGRAAHFYEPLTRGIDDRPQLEWLEEQLGMGTYLVITWSARHAKGRDFRRPLKEIERLFGSKYRATELAGYGKPQPIPLPDHPRMSGAFPICRR
jgi:hypothetical protein